LKVIVFLAGWAKLRKGLFLLRNSITDTTIFFCEWKKIYAGVDVINGNAG